jgi:hypothetical protein
MKIQDIAHNPLWTNPLTKQMDREHCDKQEAETEQEE